MPCRSYEDENQSSYIDELRRHNDRLARIACRLAEAVENGESMNDVQLNKDKASREAMAWYKDHKIADAKAAAERKTAEARKLAEQEKAKLREEVLGRLTPKEREALGIE
jgi:hypothetical protein